MVSCLPELISKETSFADKTTGSAESRVLSPSARLGSPSPGWRALPALKQQVAQSPDPTQQSQPRDLGGGSTLNQQRRMRTNAKCGLNWEIKNIEKKINSNPECLGQPGSSPEVGPRPAGFGEARSRVLHTSVMQVPKHLPLQPRTRTCACRHLLG